MTLLGLVLGIGVLGYLLFSTGEFQAVTSVLSMKLSASDIVNYASQAGFQGDDLVTAVAIALAESGGDPNIEGDKGTSIGLWQIHFTVHPEFDPNQLKDPQYNANAAFQLYTRRGQSFGDWSTYTVKNAQGILPYANFLDTADQAVNG